MSKQPLWRSFALAISALIKIIKTERNIKIQLLAAFLAVFLGIFFKITRLEWLIIVLVIFIVLAAETFNSSLEAICNLLNQKLHLEYQETKFIRDAAAGAVFLLAVGAFLLALLIFSSPFLKLFS